MNRLREVLNDDPLHEIYVGTLPQKDHYNGIAALVDGTGDDTNGLAIARIQLLEEAEYTYEVHGADGTVVLDPTEIFSPTTVDGRQGRIKTRRSVGTVVVKATRPDGAVIGTCQVEVRSRKLGYLTEYRWMIQRIADEASEAVQSQFGPSTVPAFRPSTVGDAETLYQQFAFIQALLSTPELRAALQTIVISPHEEYVVSPGATDPRRGLKGSAQLHRQLLRSGPRLPTSRVVLGLRSLPQVVPATDHRRSVDTVPNRFVRHALLEWRDLADQVADACRKRNQRRSAPSTRRGIAEATSLASRIDDVLGAEIFKEVTELGDLPVGNPVLQRGAGYRDVFRAYLQADAAARVYWKGGDDTFAAGQRDVAALYEYWVFIELARLIGEIPGIHLDRRNLFTRSKDRLTLDLRRGRASLLKGSGERYGGEVTVELWFNRTFTKDSLSNPLRPDCSLLVGWRSSRGRHTSKWLHFDAKYQVHSPRRTFVEGTPTEHSEAAPVSESLRKMHIYRDAIRRTSGAYVLYPGRDEPSVCLTDFHEILPGLGAFVLRPSDDGRAAAPGALTLRQFLEDSIDHLVSPGSDERRADFWTGVVYEQRLGPLDHHVDWCDRPPADTRVLLGFVHSQDHLDWVRRTGLYNLRVDRTHGSVGLTSPELAADVLLLYGTGDVLAAHLANGSFRIVDKSALVDSGYPHTPGGSTYCCLEVGLDLPLPESMTAEIVRSLARDGRSRDEWAAPRLVTLAAVLHACRPGLA